jgi:plasmid stabilization system protein ParE
VVGAALTDGLKNIGRYTLLGKHRPDISEGFYSFPQGEHLVFYMMQPEGIAIIAPP